MLSRVVLALASSVFIFGCHDPRVVSSGKYYKVTRDSTHPDYLRFKGTPLEDYYVHISTNIGRAWGKLASRGLRLPRPVEVTFILTPDGKLEQISFLDPQQISKDVKTIIISTLKTASKDFGPFPPEVRKQLGGESIEANYEFRTY